MMTVGYHVTAKGTRIENALIEDVNIGILVAADDCTIWRPRFRRLWSNGQNGAAIVIERDVRNCHIYFIDVDGSENRSEAAAVFFAPGSVECGLHGGVIAHHPHVGVAVGSTSYAEWPEPLPASNGHVIAGVRILACGSLAGGDAGSGIAVVGQSNDISVVDCRISYCRGAGASFSGSVEGTGALGTPKLTESPTWCAALRNRFVYNAEEGLRVVGANYFTAYDNSAYENSQAGQSRFKNYRYDPIGPGADLRGLRVRNNDSDGTMPAAA